MSNAQAHNSLHLLPIHLRGKEKRIPSAGSFPKCLGPFRLKIGARNLFQVSIQRTGTRALEPSPVASQGVISRSRNQEWNPGTVTRHAGVPSSIFTVRANAQLHWLLSKVIQLKDMQATTMGKQH